MFLTASTASWLDITWHHIEERILVHKKGKQIIYPPNKD
jgi:hypothetical protein